MREKKKKTSIGGTHRENSSTKSDDSRDTGIRASEPITPSTRVSRVAMPAIVHRVKPVVVHQVRPAIVHRVKPAILQSEASSVQSSRNDQSVRSDQSDL